MSATPEVVPPPRMARLPRDKHDRIVPWFVAYIDGEPDHRVVRPGGIEEACRFRTCWLCGVPLGAYCAFTVGPMCVINRVSAEPPSHRTCAEYAVKACPFLTTPNMRRRPDLPDNTVPPDGEMNPRNPGVCAIYVTQEWARQRGRALFSFRDPFAVTWWAAGQPATYGQALDGLVSGLTGLRAVADQDHGPEHAHELLDRQYAKALACLPGNQS